MKTWKTMLALLLILGAIAAISTFGKTIQPVNAATVSTPPPTAWSKTYGGTGTDYATSLVQTNDSGYVLAGYTSSFGAGNDDAWLIKTDAQGTMQWNKTYGGTDADYASSAVETKDGGYAFAGSTDSFGAGRKDAWLVKIDSAGSMQWNKTYGGTDFDVASYIVQTNDGGFALAGFTNSSGSSGYNSWLIKTDSAGIMQWDQTYGTTGYNPAYSVAQTSDGGYVLAGATNSFGAGSSDFWLIKTDSAGTMQWNKTYGGSGDDESYSLAKTSDGGYAVAGYTSSFGAGNLDFWLVKTDSAGIMQWNQTYGGRENAIAYSVVQTRSGGYALAGSTKSFGSGSSDFYLVKIADSGSTPTPTSTSSALPFTLYVVVALAIVIVVVAVLVLVKARRRGRT